MPLLMYVTNLVYSRIRFNIRAAACKSTNKPRAQAELGTTQDAPSFPERFRPSLVITGNAAQYRIVRLSAVTGNGKLSKFVGHQRNQV